MATIITQECINCGACEPECPNTAIYQGGVEFEYQGKKTAALQDDIFYIVPEKCTECVGFFDYEACAAVCPVDCCVTDPARPETEETLFLRAKALHPGKEFPSTFPSRFSPGQGESAGTPAKAAPTQSESTVQPVALEAATAATPVGASSKSAGAGNGASATDSKTAVAQQATAPAKSVGTAGSALNAARVERAVARPMKTLEAGKPLEPQPGELPTAFEEILARARTPRVTPSSRLLSGGLVLASPFLGALPHPTKKVLEVAAGPLSWFSAQMSTALNVVLDFLLYPLLFYVVGLWSGLQPFTEADKSWIVFGVLLAAIETVFRLRDGIFRQIPANEMRFRASLYGLPLGFVAHPLVARLTRSSTSGQVPVDGFYGKEFEAKRERERRYGEVYFVEEFDRGYYVRLELPRKIPPSAAREELSMGDAMPDYDLRVSVDRDMVTIRGSVVDPELRAVCGISPAFPADFRTRIPLPGPLDGFRQSYRDKILELAVLKAEG